MFLKFMGKIHTQSSLFHHYPMKGAPREIILRERYTEWNSWYRVYLSFVRSGGVAESLVGVALCMPNMTSQTSTVLTTALWAELAPETAAWQGSLPFVPLR